MSVRTCRICGEVKEMKSDRRGRPLNYLSLCRKCAQKEGMKNHEAEEASAMSFDQIEEYLNQADKLAWGFVEPWHREHKTG